jgi:hypothetical protein
MTSLIILAFLDVQNLSDEERLRSPVHLKKVYTSATPEKECSVTYTHLFSGKWCGLYQRYKAAVRISLHNISLKFAHQVQYSSHTPEQSFLLNCYIKIKQNFNGSE